MTNDEMLAGAKRAQEKLVAEAAQISVGRAHRGSVLDEIGERINHHERTARELRALLQHLSPALANDLAANKALSDLINER